MDNRHYADHFKLHSKSKKNSIHHAPSWSQEQRKFASDGRDPNVTCFGAYYWLTSQMCDAGTTSGPA